MRLPFLFAATLALSACGGNSSHGHDGGTTGGGDQAGGSGSGSGGGSSTSGDEVTLTMSPFAVGAGKEVYYCQTFANPFGADVDVDQFASSMTMSSHHLLLLFQDNATDGALAPCSSGLLFGPMPYGAQTPENKIVYPAGTAAHIKAGQGFNLVVHYLNATTTDIPATHVTVTMHKAVAGSVTRHAGVFFFNNISALMPPSGGIPPQTQKTISADYTTTADMDILFAVAHMHQRSQNLTATYGGQTLYTTDSWDKAPMQAYTPAVTLPKGTKITWSCTINNDTNGTLVFGESAQTNEMCIFDGQYAPAPDDSPTLSVQR